MINNSKYKILAQDANLPKLLIVSSNICIRKGYCGKVFRKSILKYFKNSWAAIRDLFWFHFLIVDFITLMEYYFVLC